MKIFETRFVAVMLFAWIVSSLLWGCAEKQKVAQAGAREPLLDNLGTLHYPMTTTNPLAQRYFDQGMRLVYAFNHEEAIRSFEEAARIDPGAAMAYWGIALALGPNINAPMDREQERTAYDAIQKARAQADRVLPKERALIEVLALRYSIAPEADRHALDQAYADSMRSVHRRYPDDLDVATLFAEALMDLHPWDYWTADGQPKPGTLETLEVLEQVLARNPDHTGACHSSIHSVEAWQPERALPCASRLATLAPGAGHLVHMPGHIYMRLGMYDKVIEHNEHAVLTDRHYLEGRRLSGIYPIGYYPHNIHFLWAGLLMQGRSEAAIKAARDLTANVPDHAIPDVPELEQFLQTPVFAMARFGKWDDILQEPPPSKDLPYSLGIWHYARGMALTAKGRADEAQEERRQLETAASQVAPDRILGLNRAADLLGIAMHVPSGHMAASQGNIDDSIRHFQEAVQLQDTLRYYEPPEWYYPVRASLGMALLKAGRTCEAEAIFREDLKRTPENPWSLYGLA